MAVIKFSLDLSNIRRKGWNKDIEKTALWVHHRLNHNKKVQRRFGVSNDKDFSFAYTINDKYKRATVFIKSNEPKTNIKIFKWRWCNVLKHHRPFAVVEWARIPLDVGHYVLKNGQCNQ